VTTMSIPEIKIIGIINIILFKKNKIIFRILVDL